MSSHRKKTRPVKVGSFIIGHGNPISIQTMWKEPLTGNIENLVHSIENLSSIGCQIIRFAVPDLDTLHSLGEVSSKLTIPVVADIHFNYKLALACLDTEIAKIRINPGNLGAKWKVKEVLQKAADRGKPIRVGINGGSLPGRLRKETSVADAMVKAAEEEIELLEQQKFSQAVFSLKSSDLAAMIEANIRFSERFDYPLHIGVTEAGPLIQGIVQNSIGISRLLRLGIGDTVRVSLSDSPENEIIAGKAILSAENLYSSGVKIISCPTCGRTTFEVKRFLSEMDEVLQKIKKNITIAVMGCEVNGPEEAKHADLGITGAGNRILLFKHGEIIARTDMESGKKQFIRELMDL